ncbi:hypothetical protein TSOC_005292 [Tetrabaena socialis]|uniref:DUF4350 domain-containing protein n=1 Tax=Tetrabaena socialis TaxID=47790 RepID=A0A2J8A6R0_9CHLO|nr:hypothetical protein TSOC_005292 [Tetrabaena socialis]|eukprot:PNH08208.1 hypothetical protein TSOC_005292 [Tetrabaena socialis]
MKSSGVGTLQRVLFAALLGVLGCGLRADGALTVSMYLSSGELDPSLDSSPQHLQRQLSELGFSVEAAVDGQPTGSIYVIPAQNGASLYSSVEDMDALASFVAAGGLVVMLDAHASNAEAQKAVIAGALGYSGDWSLCKSFGCNSHHSNGAPSLNEHAEGFLAAAAWPSQLEDARITSVHTPCLHEDASAVSWPLYHILDDPDKVVAQAFGKVGSPGAVVWLGYSWKDGPQAGWGSMLREVIEGFASGRSAREAAAGLGLLPERLQAEQRGVLEGLVGSMRLELRRAAESLVNNETTALARLDARLAAVTAPRWSEAVEGSLSGLEVAQSEGLRRLSMSLNSALADAEATLQSSVRNEVARRRWSAPGSAADGRVLKGMELAVADALEALTALGDAALQGGGGVKSVEARIQSWWQSFPKAMAREREKRKQQAPAAEEQPAPSRPRRVAGINAAERIKQQHVSDNC